MDKNYEGDYQPFDESEDDLTSPYGRYGRYYSRPQRVRRADDEWRARGDEFDESFEPRSYDRGAVAMRRSRRSRDLGMTGTYDPFPSHSREERGRYLESDDWHYPRWHRESNDD